MPDIPDNVIILSGYSSQHRYGTMVDLDVLCAGEHVAFAVINEDADPASGAWKYRKNAEGAWLDIPKEAIVTDARTSVR